MDLKSFLSTVDKDSLVGLSVPLSVPEAGAVIIGHCSPEAGSGHITLAESELKSVAELLYTDKYFPAAAHG